ncbi:MAG: 2-aminoethylphosphonate--pyruvate transaminase, partial [Alphaproteobacteria bacterium]|nr:2-aminoethylphosphonate--pyruvate transaminase [Alphaproteobacteria bacterium]
MTQTRAVSETGDPLLLTPGPLTTSKSVKAVMVHDWGSRDAAFMAINRAVLERIAALAEAEATHVTVPLQGSGTFAVEAMLTNFIAPGGKALVLVNGAYGQRACKILDYAKRAYVAHETAEDTPPDVAKFEAMLKADPAITHVFAVHCETTSGILNPIVDIAAAVARQGRRLLIDSMSAFGALPISAKTVKFDALAASSNKCLEGVPGLGFIICDKEALAASKGNATALVFDLFEQQKAM